MGNVEMGHVHYSMFAWHANKLPCAVQQICTLLWFILPFIHHRKEDEHIIASLDHCSISQATVTGGLVLCRQSTACQILQLYS